MPIQTKTRLALACGASIAAMFAAYPAFAQAKPAPAPATSDAAATTPTTGDNPALNNTPAAQSNAATPSTQDVVVTGSRAITNGASAPTPLTVVSATQLAASTPGNLAEAVGQLPVFHGSTRASTAGSAGTTLGAGANLLSMRALSPFRTLILLDGHRVVPTQLNGSTDTNLIPQALVKRVDVVTGGASAAYGSDAVAGVANFVLDTTYQGIKGELQGGMSQRGDAGSMKANLTVGHAFLDDRLHIVASADYFKQDGIDLDYNGRAWAEDGWGLIGASTTSSALIVAPDVRDALDTGGGVITGCQPVGAACPLNKMQWINPTTLAPFVQGSNVTSSTMSGGDGAARRVNLLAGYWLVNSFGHVSYDLNSNTNVYVEFLYSHLHAHYFGSDSGEQTTSALTIYQDNAFLPDNVRSLMTADGIQSFSMQRTNFDFGGSYYTNDTITKRVEGGVDGGLGGSWKYSVYGEYGESTFDLLTSNNMIVQNLYNAADAVIDPSTGQAVCRSTLLGLPQGAGCVPINLFGSGTPSAAALNYVKRTTFLYDKITQTVFSADIRGEPFSLWAGPVSFAAGGEYRRETGVQTSGPDNAIIRTGTGIQGYPAAQKNQLGAYLLAPAQPLSGNFDVKEAFSEVDVPLVKDVTAIHNLDLNAAVRYADYSSVGGVVTWKVGGNWEPVSGIRFRATRSRDIRAPSIQERFSPQVPVTGQPVNDPQNGGARFQVVLLNQGNPDLKQETADTTTFGTVLTPHFLPGFTLSVDHFNIRIKDVISAPTIQAVVDACGMSACANVIRNPDGTINSVIAQQQNLAQLHTAGEDFELDYVHRLDSLNGTLSARLLATHTNTLALTIGSVTIDRVGDLNVTPSSNPPGIPEWTGSFSLDYQGARLHLFGQERYIGSGFLDKTQVYAPGQDTHVPAVWYTDLTIGYKMPTISNSFEIYTTINNLFDQDPPITPNGALTTPRPANGALYDLVGRYFSVGVRMAF
jgi:outer membrane receptor protein involved in Fe transport